jgi:ubiquinone/menaquinone biosynthesis C-methylase UbiE
MGIPVTTETISRDQFVRAAPIEMLEFCTDIEALECLLDLDGRTLIDVGCGDGAFARLLAERSAEIIGLEPDPVQAERNRNAPATPGVNLIETDGRSIPAAEGSVDGVIFSRSLHHVPSAEMPAMLGEARRVLRNDGGVLFILEPLARGGFFNTMAPFHDETEVRAKAYGALKSLVPGSFAREREYHYILPVEFASFEVFVDKMALSASFNDYRREDIEADAVRERFELSRTDDGYRFEQPMRINLFETSSPADAERADGP